MVSSSLGADSQSGILLVKCELGRDLERSIAVTCLPELHFCFDPLLWGLFQFFRETSLAGEKTIPGQDQLLLVQLLGGDTQLIPT